MRGRGATTLVVLLTILVLLIAAAGTWFAFLEIPTKTVEKDATQTTEPTTEPTETTARLEESATVLDNDFSEVDKLETDLDADLKSQDASVSF